MSVYVHIINLLHYNNYYANHLTKDSPAKQTLIHYIFLTMKYDFVYIRLKLASLIYKKKRNIFLTAELIYNDTKIQ